MGAVINSFKGVFRFLSNFEEAEVELDGVKYPSVENAYQRQRRPVPLSASRFRPAPPRKRRRWARSCPSR
jgi:predicted NAD-dependent protein-ADP-ribosyltransferase YbiA (DUF1768 family)